MNKFSEYFKRPTSREHAQKATDALAKSVGVILASDDSEEDKRAVLAETFTEFDEYMQKHVTVIDDADIEIAKARPRDSATGAHGLAAALSEHLIDRLDHLRRKHGFEKKESLPMESIEKLKAERTEKLLAIGSAAGAVAMAKILVADNDAHGIDESEYTRIVTEHATKLYPGSTPDSAFAKVFSDNGPDGTLLRKAHAVVKSDAMNVGNDHTESSEAYDELTVKAAELRKTQPSLSEAQAFEKVFTDPKNSVLSAKAHRRPSPTTSFAFPSR
jgi:hypothetical protein